MLEKFTYINHLNESVKFGDGRIFVDQSDIRDYSWSAQIKNDRIGGFKRGVQSKSIPVVVICDTSTEGMKLRNELYEVLEKDVLAGIPGRIVLGGYYMTCFVTESKKTEYLNDYMKLTLKVTTDAPYWVKENTTRFGYGGGEIGQDLDFNRDHPYDYTSNNNGNTVNNTGFVASDFRIVIYGPAVNPVITIAGHDYGVQCNVEANEYVTIDSKKKTVIHTAENGEQTNLFDDRERDSYIFEKVPAGISNVERNANFLMDIVLFEERGEPKWI